MNYDVQLEQITDQRHVAVVRRRARQVELARIVPEACGLVWNVLRAQNVTGAGGHVTVYLDRVINLEIGVEIIAPFSGQGEVVPSSIPTGLAATTAHFGPYQKLHDAHEAIRDWCARQNHSLAGPCWEIYGHWLTEWNDDPSKIQTNVFYLIDDKARP